MELPQDRWLIINNNYVRYWHIGDVDAQPMVLTHGILSSAEYWYRVVWPLSKYYQVIAFDWPGFGKSDKPNIHYTLSYFLEFLKEFLDTLGLGPIILVGHSLGGGISLGFAGHYPSYIHRLILLDSVGFARQIAWPFRLMSLPILGRIMTRANQPLFEKALQTNVYDSSCLSQDFLDSAYKLGIESGARHTMLNILANHAGLKGIKKQPLKQVQQPLYSANPLIIWGQQDPVLNYSIHLQAIKYYFPQAPIVSIDRCGHMPQIEHSNRVVEAICQASY